MVMVIGCDIGGVNTKVARVQGGEVRAVQSQPYELQRAPEQLRDVLRGLARKSGVAPGSVFRCAVTMTAELSQMFRTKREGVAFVLDAVESAFPSSRVDVYTVNNRFVTPGAARQAPLEVAAANWAATAWMAAAHHRDALLVDTGTTTTDVIPIVEGQVRADGRTDPDRLASGELLYTGALRTPAEAIASAVPFGDGTAGVSAEGFALAGDVHVWRGDVDPRDYTVATPDGRPATREFAGERLARVVCADREMLDAEGITAIADALAAAQVERIADAVRRVIARHPRIRTAVVTGLGAFLGASAARVAGLEVVPLAATLGDAAARSAPAACVALLLERTLDREEHDRHEEHDEHEGGDPPSSDVGDLRDHGVLPGGDLRVPRGSRGLVDIVVKLGGGVLPHRVHFDAALEAIAGIARARPLLVVPGGGPFADAVREIDRRLGLSDDAAHWMAVLGMDQHAHLVASRLPDAAVVEAPDGIRRALASGRLPVLAPSGWLREADPVPHSWDVTSDSIAAWVAGQVGATELVLIKPPHALGDSLVDESFSRALPAGVTTSVVPADRLDAWRLRFARP